MYPLLFRKTLYVTTVLILISCNKSAPVKPKSMPRVEVEIAKTMRVPIEVDAIGHFRAFNSAEIKAQVEGVLMEVNYDEGDEINENDLLVTIDPRPYSAKLDQAIATRAQNVALLQYAADKVARYEPLLSESYVSELDYKQYLSNLANYEALVMQNDADIRTAEINLDYCFVKAPFNGILGKRLVDKGNLITNSGQTLVVLNQVDPIFIDFSVPERDFLKIQKYQTINPLNVKIVYPEYKDINATAKLVLIDNAVSQDTGMIPLRAQIDNPTRAFWPGVFVKLKLVLEYKDQAILVPESAIGIGQDGEYVFVINDQNVAEYRKITQGERYEGLIEITSGIKSGEQIVTSGQINILPGSKVDIVKKGVKEAYEYF